MQKWFALPLFRSPYFYLTIFFVLLVLATNLDGTGIYSAHEARNGFIARNMLRSGNFLDMQVPFGDVYEKPILTYWLTAVSGTIFGLAGDPAGSMVELAVRLPQLIVALLTVFGAALLGGRIYGRDTGLLAAAVLAGAVLFNTQARIARTDMMLAFCCTWSMVFLYFGYLQERKVNWRIYGFYLAMAAGMMFKGPVIVILSGLVVLAMMIYDRDWKMPFKLRPFTGALVFLLFGCSWYVFESIRTDGEFFREFILAQNVNRFTGSSDFRGGEWMHPLYYFQYLLVGFLPWSIFALIGLIVKWKPIVKRQLRPETIFLLAWFLTGFVFFSFSALKRSAYLLPLYPAVAILTARAIILFCENGKAISKRWRIAWGVLAVLLISVFCVNQLGWFHTLGEAVVARRVKFISKSDGVSILQCSDLASANAWLFGIALVLVCGLLLYWLLLLEKRRFYAALLIFCGLVGVSWAAYHIWCDPIISEGKSVRAFALEAASQIPAGGCYRYVGDYTNELIFYVDRPYVIGKEEAEAECGYLIYSYRAKKKPQTFGAEWELLLESPEKHERPAKLYRLKK